MAHQGRQSYAKCRISQRQGLPLFVPEKKYLLTIAGVKKISVFWNTFLKITREL